MISFNKVSKNYNHHEVLKDISFKIAPKEFVSIVGRSGTGKTTIIKLLMAEERPTKGRIVFGQYDVTKLKSHQLPELRRHMGVVFQDFKLLPKKTAYENIIFTLEVAGRSQKEAEEIALQALELVGLIDMKNNFINELSGGEKQRLAIARAMVNQPDLIIADEPTGNLDPSNTLGVINLLLKINELGTTVILATHNKEIVNHIEKRVISIEDGRIIKDEEKGRYFLV
ncbi:MAG: ATP-binding cassette domain-containing protein [Candidatus Liptonbacteria bacterium]|nr:ATP-binding cassette domain-containing protein [Candidatus Liptonbacteria bacterium]